MSNVYNILFRDPVLTASKMKPEAEQLALKLVKSGRMRIDAFEMINFVRFSHNGRMMMFSNRELFDPALLPRTIEMIGEGNVELLRKEISTNQPVPLEIEIRLARMLVQAAHPVVIRILLLERTEVFVSYSHNIGDLLDMESWGVHGRNSGMQSVNVSESRVFVSTDGDPFDRSKEGTEQGRYAFSRFMVIAAQELGHYSDLKRDPRGNPYFRFSLDPKVHRARLEDLEHVNKTWATLNKLGLKEAAKLEKDITFYKRHNRFFAWLMTVIKSHFATRALHSRAAMQGIRIAHGHSARHLAIMLSDMRFNLHPKAPAYKSDDPAHEQQIINIEALARVPQQAIKWGHKTTSFMYPQIYRIYYKEVIPTNVKYFEILMKRE